MSAPYLPTATRLQVWRDAGLGRHTTDIATGQHPVIETDGGARLLFSSSNYLGLSHHPAVVEAAVEATFTYGTGSGGSRLTTGSTPVHRALEEELADWLGYPDCVLLNTGFAANLAALTVLADASVTVFSDAHNHASIIDGCRAARTNGARLQVYPHRDTDALARLLERRTTEHGLVVTDGVFSMGGTLAPVAEIVSLAHDNGCAVMVDDAHGIGTVGDGRGCAAPGAQDAPDVLVGTLSKALGAEGGFICADRDTCDLLRNQARPFIYSTSSPVPTVAAALAAVRLVRADESLVRRLQDNVRRLTDGLGLVGHPGTPIVPVPVGDERAAMAVAAELRQAGFHIPAIRYPTVPRGEAILRVTVMATHTGAQIDALLEALAGVTSVAGPPPDAPADAPASGCAPAPPAHAR
ncbi:MULTISPECIES: aminotransferase class I/II-fold pyridoxal phosphate-dependent enzyme [unclassified Corynebacterium]|uniref:aminotransferase class I/II-fold pyridoxal phosphate-dependent enzyme n=1 Tax=unclassified Corynebacterium TaxID=2624378 RepID=UPI004034CACE